MGEKVLVPGYAVVLMHAMQCQPAAWAVSSKMHCDLCDAHTAIRARLGWCSSQSACQRASGRGCMRSKPSLGALASPPEPCQGPADVGSAAQPALCRFEGEPEAQLNPKKKVFEKIAAHFKTSAGEPSCS